MAPRREHLQLPVRVANTIVEARVPSTRRLYTLKWSVFSGWCAVRNEDPSSCEVSTILSFLQKLLDKGHSPSTLKVYVVAIVVNHSLGATQSV